MKFACAFDHAGVPLRETVITALQSAGHDPQDLGTADDYPDVALRVCRSVIEGEAERGIVVCGSGAGVSVACCKVPGIRATVAHDHYTAGQMVGHDNCNVLCIGARVVGTAIAAELVQAFAEAQFTGEERHVRRLGKVDAIEHDGLHANLEGS